MRIDSSGNVGIGTSSPSGKFEVSGGRSWFTANSETYSIAFRYSSSSNVMYMGATNSATVPSIQFSNSGGAALATIDYSGNLSVTGTASATSFTASSDERLKTNWVGLDSDFVPRLADVKHGTFERISSGNREVGVSAQSLEELLPEAVIKSEEGLLGVNYGGAALVAAIELAKEVRALRAEIEELKRSK
jgi:hypothetical protein